jgi:hypothetical protein
MVVPLESATQRLFRLAPFTYEYEYWLFMSSKFHVGDGRNIRRGKPQMSAFSSHICV